MSLFSALSKVPEYYMITVMNSTFSAYYIDSFVNSTSHCTTGDAKLLPILIPNNKQLEMCKSLFDSIIDLKKKSTDSSSIDNDVVQNIDRIEVELDEFVRDLYGI
jgi:hypothetical protein